MGPDPESVSVREPLGWPAPSVAPIETIEAGPALPDRVTGLLMIGIGVLPFFGGTVLRLTDLASHAQVSCLVQLATGLPCPVCGGTRAFIHASGGDPVFLQYNGFWVLAAVVLILAGLAVMFTKLSLAGFWSRWGRLPVYLVLAALASGWIWAFVNRGTIVTG